MSDPQPSLSAFLDVPPHLTDAHGRWFAWLTEPSGLYVASSKSVHVGDDFLMFLQQPCRLLTDQTFGGDARLSVAIDFSHVSSYSVTVRARLLNWGMSDYSKKSVAQLTALVGASTTNAARVSLKVGAMVMSSVGLTLAVADGLALGWHRELRPLARTTASETHEVLTDATQR